VHLCAVRPLALLACLSLSSTALAEPGTIAPDADTVIVDTDSVVTLAPSASTPLDEAFPRPPRRLRHSYLGATGEILGINAMFSLVALAIGKEYVKISPSSIWKNLNSDWVWDEDAFDTNQFGHPYLGSLMYSAARSNGFSVMGASVATFLGSAFWELFMETETPSINDQIFTPIGGILLGEVLHRYSRAVLWSGDPRPRAGRVALATVTDPIGMFTRSALGEAWTIEQPPDMFGYLAVGWNGLSADFSPPDGEPIHKTSAQFRVSLGLTYGIPTSAAFEPQRPMDHFEMTVDGGASPHSWSLALHTRGLLWGRAFALGRARALGGVYGGYDFENPERIRIGAASLGVGATMHLPFGSKNFLQGTFVVSAIPFGAAGGGVEEVMKPGLDRDYHRGPGSTQSLQLRLGRKGLGAVYLDSRNFEINGEYFDEGSEVVSLTRLGAQLAIYGRHGLSIESQLSVRHATFEDPMHDVLDTSAQFRISYVLFQDRSFGGGSR
jgi:hypothetical protein